MAAFCVPYSPKGRRGAASVTGTSTGAPCTQIVPQCNR